MDGKAQPRTPQVGEFYRARRLFLQNWPEVRKVLGLGAEYKTLALFVERCPTTNPWAWVQTETQAHWAACWCVPERTFKRHLKLLVDQHLIEVEVAKATAGVRRPKLKAAFEFPIYRVHPALMDYVVHFTDPCHWPASMLWRSVETGTEARLDYQEAVKCQIGTKRALDTHDTEAFTQSQGENPGYQSNTGETPGSEGSLRSFTSTIEPVYIGISNSNSNTSMKGSDRVRRRRRRRTSGSETEMARRPIDDDEPPAIGADPDRPTRARSSSSIQPVLDSFAREWDAARRGQSTHLPDRIFGPRNDRIACMAWLKGTFMPDVAGGDPDLATEIFRTFCQRVVRGEQGWAYRPNPAKGTWSIWRHLSPRAEQARQLVVRDGWKTADEKAAQVAAEQERDALVEQVMQRRDQQAPLVEEYLADLEGSVRLITFADNGLPVLREFHFLDEAQTCDYKEWVDVDVDPLLGRISFADWKIRRR